MNGREKTSLLNALQVEKMLRVARSRTKTNGLRWSPVQKRLADACAFGLGKRKDCAFLPMLMRRDLLSGGVIAVGFVELTRGPGGAPVAATAPLYAERALVGIR